MRSAPSDAARAAHGPSAAAPPLSVVQISRLRRHRPVSTPPANSAGERRSDEKDALSHGQLRSLAFGHQALDQRDRAWLAASRDASRGRRLPPTSSACGLPCPSHRASRPSRRGTDDVVRATIGGAVHRRQSHRVDGVHVDAELVTELHASSSAFGAFVVRLVEHPVHARRPPSAPSCLRRSRSSDRLRASAAAASRSSRRPAPP